MAQTEVVTLESIVLSNDRRGMTLLRPYLPMDFCWQATKLAYTQRARVLIITGFYLAHLSAPETDGPPGALALGRALTALGGQVTYVSDRYTAPLMEQFGSDHAQTVTFPIVSEEESQEYANKILGEVQPTLVVSIERCGVTRDGCYRNVRLRDISHLTARLDPLFSTGIPSIGIGDGGNEIGMGNLIDVIPTIPGLPASPAVTKVSSLIAASVSNWGAYGLVAGLSAIAGQDLLPSEKSEEKLLRDLFAAGCYDGVGPTPAIGVDGYSIEENSEILRKLRVWLSLHDKRGDLDSGSL